MIKLTQSQAYRLVPFNSNGDVEATGTTIALRTLPLPVRQTLTNHYPTRKVCQANETTNARTGGLTYEMATCESFISSTITLTTDGLKVLRARRN